MRLTIRTTTQISLGFIAACLLLACSRNDAARGAAAGGRDDATVVRAVPVVAQRFAEKVNAVGTAMANQSVEITVKVTNTVTAIGFAEGKQVARGAVLARLDSAEPAATLRAAEAALSESRRQYRRSRELATSSVLSQAQLEQIESARDAAEANYQLAQARLANNVIRAPFAGRAGLRRVSVGSLVTPGTVITTLDDVSVIKLEFTVPETQLYLLAVGRQIQANAVGLPGREFTGVVSDIDSRVDPVSRAIRVRARLPNRDGLLRPGMFMSVTLSGPDVTARVVPESAVVPEQGRTYVFTLRPDDTVTKREVRIGRRQVGVAEILDGPQLGELVVSEGTQSLRDGSRVRRVDASDHANR